MKKKKILKPKDKILKPKDFVFPRSGYVFAAVAEENIFNDNFQRYVQFHSGGTRDPKTIRKLAKWLLDVADWVDGETK